MPDIENKHGLGYIYAPDVRNKNYPLRSYMAEQPKELPAEYIYKTGAVLDQGQTPRCVGYGSRQFLQSEPGFLLSKAPSPLTIYKGSQKLDGIGGIHDGSTVLGAMKYLSKRKMIGTYAWATEHNTIREWILGGKGPVLVGLTWYDDMFAPDSDHVIHVGGKVAGGHCFLLNGASDTRQAYRMINSWGSSWGDNGQAWLSYNDLIRLLADQGEACTTVEIIKNKK